MPADGVVNGDIRLGSLLALGFVQKMKPRIKSIIWKIRKKKNIPSEEQEEKRIFKK